MFGWEQIRIYRATMLFFSVDNLAFYHCSLCLYNQKQKGNITPAALKENIFRNQKESLPTLQKLSFTNQLN